jgi:hypothetical protein
MLDLQRKNTLNSDVQKPRDYWNLLNKAACLKIRKPIGPLTRSSKSLVVDDEEKASLLNTYFVTTGETLSKELPQPTDNQYFITLCFI